MARDQVRTQVLLLHSEQQTLDRLSAGFDDRYTVHCATSGTEALNTLSDTPIHVIVSARDLPGMSGVEALREAKKRSPETIGILLAGDNDAGLEALVGEKEVFQVISGAVQPGELTRLVDNATRQMRLLALAESANDTAANPDEPAEHIVMETSENGAAIISGGTGTMPALDPTKVATAVSAGSSTVDVLVLTKDEEFLATIRQSTRGMHKVHYANTLAQAEQAIAVGKVGVAVVDAAMVGENVEKLTQHLRRKTRRLVNIVAGRRDDGEMLMDLINRGKVYRFLLKPVSPGRARLAIEASVKHHLEAPETAFQGAGSARAGGKPAAKPAPQQATTSPAPKRRRPPAAPTATPPGTPDPVAADVRPVGDALGGAFGVDDSSFTETMTGIVTNLGRALTKKRDKPADKRPEPRVEPVIANRRGPAPSPAAPLPPPVATPGRPSDVNAGDSRSSFANPKVLGAAAAAVVTFALIGYFVFGGSDDSSPGQRPSTQRSASAEAGTERAGSPAEVSRSQASGQELLDEARLARQAGQIYNPPGGNAIELYVDALSAMPGNATASAELAAVIDEALRMAESALLERRASDAAAALERVAFADSGNGRLPFLFAQLSQMQLREYVDAGRAALRDSRFEDAASAIAAARLLEVADMTEIEALAQELAAARSAQRVDEVLARAAQRLEQGSLITPANDNARYYFDLVLSSDPGNILAQQGLSAIASKLVLQARTEIDAARFDPAAQLLEEAGRLDPSSAGLADANQALAAARERELAQQRARDAQRAAEEKAEEQREANERAEAERRAAVGREQQSIETSVPDAGGDAAVATAGGAAAGDAGSASAAGPGAGNDATVQRELLPISELTRVKYVAPKYPRAAERRSLSGWVDVVFTVKADGSTGDIEVRDAEPGDMFINAALRAVEDWEFEPIVEDGRVVERQAGVRLMFALE